MLFGVGESIKLEVKNNSYFLGVAKRLCRESRTMLQPLCRVSVASSIEHQQGNGTGVRLKAGLGL